MANSRAKLIIRPAELADVKDLAALSTKVYGARNGYTQAHIRGQINNFPEGQFLAEFEGKIVGYCATLIVPDEAVFRPHSFNQISGSSFGATHDPEGNILYGIEVCVDPEYRRLRIGQRFYQIGRHV